MMAYTRSEKKSRQKLLDMLTYMRPDNSAHQELFCKRFIEPLMGKPDLAGNYIHLVGDSERICFMAHHDTVHRKSGIQAIKVLQTANNRESVVAVNSDCLGADCTTGVWLILEMIKAKVPGLYIIHSGEEIGCIGSKAIVDSNPDWLENVKIAISFDRRGYDSIITEQCSTETCSEEFAKELADILDIGMKPDPTGAFTDSYEYRGVVSECTNISVGYFLQHTAKEWQDLTFVMQLRKSLIKADWSLLSNYREPKDDETWYGWPSNYRSKFDSDDWWDNYYKNEDNIGVASTKSVTQFTGIKSMSDVCKTYPNAVAEILEQYGYDKEMLIREIQELYMVSNYKI